MHRTHFTLNLALPHFTWLVLLVLLIGASGDLQGLETTNAILASTTEPAAFTRELQLENLNRGKQTVLTWLHCPKVCDSK